MRSGVALPAIVVATGATLVAQQVLVPQDSLKLESTRGLVDVLVIDSAERPTPN